jgi:hypothetical protein
MRVVLNAVRVVNVVACALNAERNFLRKWDGFCRALAFGFLLMALIPGLASEADAACGSGTHTAAVLSQGHAPSGFRCETRNRAREVSRRNFVIDRVTECLPIFRNLIRTEYDRGPHASLRQAIVPAPQSLAPSAATTSPVSTPATEPREIPAARCARWSRGRDRLSNAQHDRILRAMAGVFPRTRR